MADVVQKEISFPIIPESINNEMRDYFLRMQEIIREVSLGASYLSAVTLQEFSADGAGFLDEDDMASDSNKAAVSQQSLKAYVATKGYVERGNASVSDFDEGDTPAEAAWTDLDLGPNGLNIVPLGAKAVNLFLRVKDGAASKVLLIRKNGSTSDAPGSVIGIVSEVSNIANYGGGVVGCDADGVVEYYITADIDEFDVTVMGWFL